MSVHTFGTMGTVASLRLSESTLTPDDLADVRRVFDDYERDFSLYRPTSPLSRMARGELALHAADRRIRETYEMAIDWRSRTGGAFTPHRPDGVIDLSGVVKARAMADAAVVLEGCTEGWLLSVGGDVVESRAHHCDPWRIGLVDPTHRDQLAGVVVFDGARRALATSGTTERGQHLWRQEKEEYVQVTVAADDILTADVLATAIAAGDRRDLDRITREYDIDVVTFDRLGNSRATPGARAWVRRPAD